MDGNGVWEYVDSSESLKCEPMKCGSSKKDLEAEQPHAYFDRVTVNQFIRDCDSFMVLTISFLERETYFRFRS